MACYKITTVVDSTNALQMTFPKSSITVKNGERACFIICTNLPSMTTVVPVTFNIGGTQVPLYDMLGNVLYSDQLRTRVCIPGVWGTNPNHFKLCACVDGRSQTTNVCATIPAATTPAT